MRNPQAAGEGHNLIAILQEHGYSEQLAMDEAGVMLQKCHEDWDEALLKLPTWGSEVDEQVRRYVSLCCNIAVGSMRWSYERLCIFFARTRLRGF